MHPTEIICKCRGFKPKIKPEKITTTCKITGISITDAYSISKIAPAALNDYNGIFGGISGYVCKDVAAVIQNDWNFGSWVMFANGDAYHMLVDRKQAEKLNRPYWSKLVREIYPARKGDECMMIFTSDFKKRTWHNAVTGSLGSNTPVFIYSTDFGLSKNVYLDWEKLLSCLELVEEIYTKGISKPVIYRSLYDPKNIQKYGYETISNYEKKLQPIRKTHEFIFSLIIGQKYET